MSGSFDRPTGRPTHCAAHQTRVEPTLRDGPQTGSPCTVTRARTGTTSRFEHSAVGSGRTRRTARNLTNAPIVPAGSVTGRSLTVVITIMCFLASLTAGAVYMMNQSASAWLRDIASEVTVQIEAKERVDLDKHGRRCHRVLVAPARRRAGACAERGRCRPAAGALARTDRGLEGAARAPSHRGRARPQHAARFRVLRTALVNNFPGVTIDDHRRWQRQIRTITRSFALGGLAILLLVGAATTAIIVSATKSAMASNRDIVEVLHFVGATDRFIAREFERHFLRLGVRAGVVGALWATFVFLAMPTVMELMGGGAVTIAEIRRLIGIATLDPPGYFLLGIVVLVIAALVHADLAHRRLSHPE